MPRVYKAKGTDSNSSEVTECSLPRRGGHLTSPLPVSSIKSTCSFSTRHSPLLLSCKPLVCISLLQIIPLQVSSGPPGPMLLPYTQCTVIFPQWSITLIEKPGAFKKITVFAFFSCCSSAGSRIGLCLADLHSCCEVISAAAAAAQNGTGKGGMGVRARTSRDKHEAGD